MGKYIQWIEHKGVKILLVNYAGLQDEGEYMQAIDEFEAETLSQPKGRKMRVLVNVTDSVLTPRITERNKEVEQKARESGIPDSPTALVGLSGFKMAVVQALAFFRPDLYTAESVEAAKEWLVKQSIEE
jgi:hypothetical protein